MSLVSNLEVKKITKESIQTALILLLREKRWQDITINSLVEKAGVSRMAYYRNYKSKEDILVDIFDEFMARFTEISLPYLQTKRWYDYWKVLFDYVAGHVEDIKLLLACNYKVFILDYLNDFFIKSMRVHAKTLSILDCYRIYGRVGLCFNILVEWIENDMPISSEKLAQMCFESIKY